MKSSLHLITVAAVALFSRGIGSAQDAPPTPDVPEPRPAAGAAAASQVDQARQQLDRARVETDRARAEFERAGQRMAATVRAPEGSFSTRLNNIIRLAGGGGGVPAKPLVIRTSSMAPKVQAGIEEDLEIMTRILDKAVQDVAPTAGYRAMGIDVFSPGSSPLRNLYLEGYGAVFMVKVGFPLLPPPAPAAEQSKQESAGDSAWERAKEELYGQGPAGLPPGAGQEFNAAKVEELKSRLVEALKSASNIRELKPDDSVTICAFGGTARGGGQGQLGTHTTMDPMTGLPANVPAPPHVTWAEAGGGPERATVMTIRARKADIDAFAKGKLEAEQFRNHVRLEVYAGPGSGGSAPFGLSAGGY